MKTGRRVRHVESTGARCSHGAQRRRIRAPPSPFARPARRPRAEAPYPPPSPRTSFLPTHPSLARDALVRTLGCGARQRTSVTGAACMYYALRPAHMCAQPVQKACAAGRQDCTSHGLQSKCVKTPLREARTGCGVQKRNVHSARSARHVPVCPVSPYATPSYGLSPGGACHVPRKPACVCGVIYVVR